MNADVSVRDVMDREYVGVSESDDLLETVELLLREGAEAAVVQRGSEHVGVLSERDVLALLVTGEDLETATVGDAMTESVPTVSPDTILEVAADEMSTRGASRLVVTNGSEPLGVIAERDLLANRAIQARDQSGATQEAVESSAGAPMEAESHTGVGGEVDAGFEEQGICESCGTLAGNLAATNGQLLCPDCRAM